MANWQIEGSYMETCNCEFICPCISSNMEATPTEGDCKAAVAMHIEKGQKGGVKLDGISFIVLMRSPGPMIEGNIKVGLIVDEIADEAQTAAIVDIATGVAGGPMEALGPLVGEVAGVEKRPIRFDGDGMKFRVVAGELIDQAIEGVPSMSAEGEPIYIENTGHPVSSRLALAKALKSKFHAFGIEWNDSSGGRNGHFARFAWSAYP